MLLGCEALFQPINLGGAEDSPPTRRKVIHGEGTDAGPNETPDGAAHGQKHFADLPFESLLEHHRGVAAGMEMDGFHLGVAFEEGKSSEEDVLLLSEEGFIQVDLVFLIEAVARVRDALSEVAVVGQEEEAFAFSVEPTDVAEVVPFFRKEVEDGLPPLLIERGGCVTGRLVEKDDGFATSGEFTVVAGDDFLGTDTVPKIRTHFTIDGDTAFFDQRFTRTP